MINWALLSTARINDYMLAGIEGADGARALAVASRSEARAKEYAAAHNVERGYGSYDALLADPDVDIVYISLPNGMHVEWTQKALRAGKHVLCEKPLSRRSAEVVELFDLARANGVHLSEAFMYRHNPQTIRLKELVNAGVIGDLRLISSQFSFNAPAGDVRLAGGGLDGGSLMDLGCYPLSLARLLAGEPERVSAEQVLGGDGVDVVLATTLRFAGGVLAHFDCGLTMPGRGGFEVVGSTGTLNATNPWRPTEPPIIVLRRDGSAKTEGFDVPLVDSYVLQARDITEAVRGEHAPLLGRDDAVGQARAIEALYKSAESGQTVVIRPLGRRLTAPRATRVRYRR